MKLLLKMIPVLFLLSACQVSAGIDDSNYSVLSTPQPTTSADKIEVLEFFWYGCSHCHSLEPSINRWLKNKPDDVEFVRVPAIFNKRWELFAQAYYTARFLGVEEKIHPALFNAIHVKGQKIDSEDRLRDFFASQGVAVEDFNKTVNSFAVSMKVSNAKQMSRRYGLTGVPAVIVNGKYKTSGKEAGATEKIMQVVDHLVAQERKQNNTSASTASQ